MDKLFFKKPALRWIDGTPVGNGITGAMVYGGKRKEVVAFNNVKLWSGYPKNHDSEESLNNLQAVRNLIFDGKYVEAERQAKKLEGDYSESFLPLGELEIKYSGIGSHSYKRTLDLSTGIYTIESDGRHTEIFCSYPDKVFCYRIVADKKFSVKLTAKSKLASKSFVKDGKLMLVGNAPDKDLPPYVISKNPTEYNEGKGMSFALAVAVETDGKVVEAGCSLKLVGAKTATFFVATDTGYVNYDKMPIPDREYASDKCVSALCSLDDYSIIKRRHEADYTNLYNRQSLSLNEESDLGTDALVGLARKGKPTKALVELLYNFGKYLTISSSRLGGEPSTLQGIWNNVVRPPWSSNYTVNINTEMNYWGTSAIGLTECVEPLVDYVYDLSVKGKQTATVNYGAGGFCANHNADIWRHTAPVKGSPSYMFAPLCGIWLANEVVEHYRYGGLEAYKDKVTAIIDEGARFVLDFLVEHNGTLVTCPSASPENQFYSGARLCSLGYASAFDLGVVREALANAIEYSSDEQLVRDANEALGKLRPFTIGKYGINEWHDDFDTQDKGHRHFSPLYALYPGRSIGYNGNKEVVKAMQKLYEYRLDNARLYHGWSGAWAICLAGRLRNSERASKVISNMLGHSIFKNLLDMHPPAIFQIDGNFGFVAGVNEILATVEDGVLELLPALPKDWNSGSIRGLRLPYGATLDFEWEDGKVCAVAVNGGNYVLADKNLKEGVKVSGIKVIGA